MVLKDGGVLLEHLAHLATNVMGLSAAVIGVVDRRKGQEPRRAAHGLAPGHLALIKTIYGLLYNTLGLRCAPHSQAGQKPGPVGTTELSSM